MRTSLVSGSQQPLNIANLRYLAKVFSFSRGDHNKNSTRIGWKQAVGLNSVCLGKWTTWFAIWWGDPISIELMVGKGLLREWRILGPNEALFRRIKSGQLRSPKMWRVEVEIDIECQKIKQNHVKSPVTCSFALLFPIFYASPASAPSASNTSVAWNWEGDLQSFNRTVCNPFKTRYIVQPCTAPIVMHRLIIFGNAICVEMRVNLPVYLSEMGLVHFTLVPCFWPEFKNNIGCERLS